MYSLLESHRMDCRRRDLYLHPFRLRISPHSGSTISWPGPSHPHCLQPQRPSPLSAWQCSGVSVQCSYLAGCQACLPPGSCRIEISAHRAHAGHTHSSHRGSVSYSQSIYHGIYTSGGTAPSRSFQLDSVGTTPLLMLSSSTITLHLT